MTPGWKRGERADLEQALHRGSRNEEKPGKELVTWTHWIELTRETCFLFKEPFFFADTFHW